MALKPILILTAGFGEGHNAAARNVLEAVKAAHPDAEIEICDIFDEAYGSFNRFCQKSYVALINNAPALWNLFFQWLHHSSAVPKGIGIFGRAAKMLEKKIATIRPAVVLTTYPGYNHLLDHIFPSAASRDFRLITIVTDSITVNSVWYRCQSDVFLVANDRTAAVMLEAGVPAEKLISMGFPVPRVFASLPKPREIPPADGKWKVLYIINSGRNVAPAIARRLMQISNVSLIVTVGRDVPLGEEIQAISTEEGQPVSIHGWTKELPRLMAECHILVSKAGGATVQEAMAAGAPMIITQIVPGQEEGNAKLVLENGAGAFASTPPDIASVISKAFAGGAKQYRDWTGAVALLSRPSASDEIARYIAEWAN